MFLSLQDMGFELRDSMAQGIDECLVVLMFLSKEYMNKVRENRLTDNVVFEYNMTINWKTRVEADNQNMFIPVIMESFETDSGFMFPDDPRVYASPY
jgi:hypothetical protein